MSVAIKWQKWQSWCQKMKKRSKMGPFHTTRCCPVPKICHELVIFWIFHRTGIFFIVIDVLVKVRQMEIWYRWMNWFRFFMWILTINFEAAVITTHRKEVWKNLKKYFFGFDFDFELEYSKKGNIGSCYVIKQLKTRFGPALATHHVNWRIHIGWNMFPHRNQHNLPGLDV